MQKLNKQCKVSDDGIREIARLYRGGESCESIARAMSLHPSSVRKIIMATTANAFRVLGGSIAEERPNESLGRTRSGDLSDDTIIEIGRLYKSGKGSSRISRELGIAPTTIERVLGAKTKAAKRIFGGSIVRPRPVSARVKPSFRAMEEPEPEEPKPKRETIFIWADRWMAEQEEKVAR